MSESTSLEYYCTKDETWCAVPYGEKQYIIIHNGSQVRLCRSLDTAKKYINKNSKLCM